MMDIEVVDRSESDYRRLKKLNEFDLDYRALQPEFLNLVELAAKITDTKISLVNLIDNYTQWTVSSKSLKLQEIDREYAVCNHTIEKEGYLEIPRLDEDERFRDFDYVKGEEGLKYYLGIPLKVESGENIGALCIVDHEEKNISQEKKELLQLIANEIVNKLERKKKISHLQHEVDELVRQRNQVAHDVRGPLSGIIGLAEDANQDELSPEESRSYFKMIGRSANGLMDLTNDILENFSEISESNLFTIKELKSKLQNLYEPTANRKGIDFEINSRSTKQGRKFPKRKLIPIAGNIIANAIKFTPPGGKIEVQLDLILDQKDSFLRIYVKDNGCGFEKTKLKTFDEELSVGESGTNGEKSYGLGLRLVNEMVSDLKGKMNIDSEKGKGTEIEIMIPVN